MANDESNDGSNEVVHDVDTLVEKPSPRDTPATKKSSYKKGSKKWKASSGVQTRMSSKKTCGSKKK